MIELHKDGDSMGLVTDCSEEYEFRGEFAEMLALMIDQERVFVGDWEFQFGFLLRDYADIVCALRGYKNDVKKKIVLIAGDLGSGTPLATFDRQKHVVGYDEARADLVHVPAE